MRIWKLNFPLEEQNASILSIDNNDVNTNNKV